MTGVTWKNRKALAERKAKTVVEKGLGAGTYDIKYRAIETGVKGIPVFERAAAAKKKEEERQNKNANLAIRRAQDLIASQSRAEYLSTQLPKKWVPEDMTKPVFSYKEPTPLPRQAMEKKKLEDMAEAARQTYLSTQMPSDWTVKKLPEEQQPLHKNIGRDSVVVKEDLDGNLVPRRVAFTEDISAVKSPTGVHRGPGAYDPFNEPNKFEDGAMRESVMALAPGRDDAAGPFGERPANAAIAEIEDMGGREGDRLLLDVERSEMALRESIKGGVIGVAGIDNRELDEDNVRDGDELILEVGNMNRFGKLKEPAKVDFTKMQGRDSTAWDMDDKGTDIPGDNLILDVDEAKEKIEKKTQNVVIGAERRWADVVEGADGNILTLSPHVTPIREKAVVGFVQDFSKMSGRDDNGDEDEIIVKLDGDAKELEAWIAKTKSEAESNVAALIEGGKVGHRVRSVTLVDMAKSKVERFASEEGNGDGQSEIKPNWKIGLVDRNKVLVNMEKEPGRVGVRGDDYVNDLGAVVEGDGGGRDGDRLVLEKGDDAIRFKGVMVGESISKQRARWKEDFVEDGGGERVYGLFGDRTRYGEKSTKVLVDMKNQSGRYESEIRKGADDIGVAYGETEGGNLILSPHPSVVLPRKETGTVVIKQSSREKFEQQKIEKGFEERAERRKLLDEKREARRMKEKKKKERKRDKVLALVMAKEKETKEEKVKADLENKMAGINLDDIVN